MNEMKKIYALWAEDETGVIGYQSKLPWHLPAELKHFKETTMNQAILMGRVTFDGMNRRVLPGRTTLILTSDKDYQVDGVQVVHSVEEVLDWYASQDKNLYIIGGAKVFEEFSGYYDGLIKTTIHGTFQGDTYFPELDFSSYQERSQKHVLADEKNSHAFTVTYFEKV